MKKRNKTFMIVLQKAGKPARQGKLVFDFKRFDLKKTLKKYLYAI